MQIINVNQNTNNLKDKFNYNKTVECIPEHNKSFSFITSQAKDKYTNEIKYLVSFKLYNSFIVLTLSDEEYSNYIDMMVCMNKKADLAEFKSIGKFNIRATLLEDEYITLNIEKSDKIFNVIICQEELESYINVLKEIKGMDILEDSLSLEEKKSLYNEALLCFIDSALDRKNKELFDTLSKLII